MQYTITNEDKINISFSPVNEIEEILQNVKTIISTPKWSVPLDRSFGIDMSFLDKPATLVESLVKKEIVIAIANYEPRCRLSEVHTNINENSKVVIKVVVEL